MFSMTIAEALKWADVFGQLQSDPPSGDAPALMALSMEVRRLERELIALKRGEFICSKCGLRVESYRTGDDT